MEVRRITLDELIQYEKLMSIAFLYPIDTKEVEKKAKENPSESYYRHVWGVFSEDNELISGVIDWPFSMYYEGESVGMSGIGGVSSAPEARRQGGIRQIMKKALSEDREKGLLFSVLFPFSHRFYRKFGYEICHEGRRVRVPIQALSKYENTASVRMYKPEKENDSAFREIYEVFASRYNYAVSRDDTTWKRIIKGDPHKAEAYTYIFSRDGKDVAYCIYKTVRDAAHETTLSLIDYAYVDKKGLWDLLGFFFFMSAQYRMVQMELPDDVEMGALVDESYDVKVESPVRTMARILDVPEVLRRTRFPFGEGAYTVYVEDEFLPENTGTYQVRCVKGKVEVSKDKKESADICLSVQALTQLCLGYLSLSAAEYKKDVTVIKNRETLERVFVKKDKFLFDRF